MNLAKSLREIRDYQVVNKFNEYDASIIEKESDLILDLFLEIFPKTKFDLFVFDSEKQYLIKYIYSVNDECEDSEFRDLNFQLRCEYDLTLGRCSSLYKTITVNGNKPITHSLDSDYLSHLVSSHPYLKGLEVKLRKFGLALDEKFKGVHGVVVHEVIRTFNENLLKFMTKNGWNFIV